MVEQWNKSIYWQGIALVRLSSNDSWLTPIVHLLCADLVGWPHWLTVEVTGFQQDVASGCSWEDGGCERALASTVRCRRKNCLTLCNVLVSNGCYKCTIHYYSGVFSQSYWFPVKTCTQWLHSRGSGGGGVWNSCSQNGEKKKVFTRQMLLSFYAKCFVFFGVCVSHAFTYLLLFHWTVCYRNFLLTHSEREGQRSKPQHTAMKRADTACILRYCTYWIMQYLWFILRNQSCFNILMIKKEIKRPSF